MTPSPAAAEPLTLSRELADDAASETLGAAVAGLLRRGDVVALFGELGVGKTTLARAMLHRLGHRGEVPSPTFTLVQIYDVAPVAVWHFDLFRIGDPDEVVELGFEEAQADAISLIEWPERMGAYLPAERLDIELSYSDGGDRRRAVLRGHGGWRRRLAEARDVL